ncbi:hypothetical protein [Pseudomonas phage Clover]|nr:hypothetical protein [Pseudomonas phage Clover]
MSRPDFLSAVAYRGWYRPSKLDRLASIIPSSSPLVAPFNKFGGARTVSGFLKRKAREMDAVPSKQGLFRLVDVETKALAEGLQLAPPLCLSREPEEETLDWLARQQEQLADKLIQLSIELGGVRDALELCGRRVGREQFGEYLFHLDAVLEQSFEPNDLSGVYFLIRGDRIVYVGQSLNAPARILEHQREAIKKFERVFIHFLPPESLVAVEGLYIGLYQPEYNKTPGLPLSSFANKLKGVSHDPAIA